VPDDGYRLAALLELRRREEESRQGDVAQAAAATSTARDALRAAKACRDQARERRVEAVAAADSRASSGQASAGDLAQARGWLDRLAVAVARADAVVAEAAAALRSAEEDEDRARQALTRTAAERQAIEKHREKWLAERKREAERKAEEIQDDLHKRK